MRRPGVAFTRWAERNYLWPRVIDLFTWNDRRAGVYPTFSVDFGINQTVGLALFWRELGVPAHTLRWSASTGFGRLFTSSAQDRLRVFRNGSGAVFVNASFADRPDGVYYGIGPDRTTGRGFRDA